MARLHKEELLGKVTASIKEAGWGVALISKPTAHPSRLRVFSAEEVYNVRVYIWNMTHGGGRLRPADEYRIQITGVPRFEPEPGGKTVILGWWDEVGVFAGFDYRRHSGRLGYSPSMQIRERSLMEAYERGISAHRKVNREIVIAFRPSFLVEYIRFLEPLHDIGKAPVDFEIFSSITADPEAVSEKEIAMSTRPRRQVLASVKRTLRDVSFSARVLTAYSHYCAVCSVQLELVEAAHIIPVAIPGSTDETANGIALCPLHHKAYDRALISVNEKYRVLISKLEQSRLKEVGHDGGLVSFVRSLRPVINLPPSKTDRPKPEYLKTGMGVRNWSG